MIAENIVKLQEIDNWTLIQFDQKSFFFNPKENLVTFHPIFSFNNFDFFSV